jgi:hypothetical protein
MSLPEWRAVLSALAPRPRPSLDRAGLETLMKEFPDG